MASFSFARMPESTLTIPRSMEDPKVRLRDDLYAQLDEIVRQSRRDENLTKQNLVAMAVEEFLARRATGDYEATPQTPDERDTIKILLAVLRNPRPGSPVDAGVASYLKDLFTLRKHSENNG